MCEIPFFRNQIFLQVPGQQRASVNEHQSLVLADTVMLVLNPR